MMMKRFLVVILLALLPCTQALADMDVEQEKRDAAAREAAQKAQAEKQREIEKMKGDSAARANAAMNKHLTDAQRKALGLPPAGGSTSK
jgi:hypothetical protein